MTKRSERRERFALACNASMWSNVRSLDEPGDVSLQTAPPIVIVGNRWKAARILLLSLGFVAAGGFVIFVQNQPIVGVPAILFFGAYAALSSWLTIIPPKLILTDDGIEYRSIRSWRMKWKEIGGTRLRSTEGNSILEVVYADEAETPARSDRRRARAVSSYLWMSPAEVRALIEDRLAAARAASPGSKPWIDPMPVSEVTPSRWRVPWVSLGLIAILVVAYSLEVRFPLSPQSGSGEPSVETLAAFGGSSRALTVGEGQWSRLLTAPFLHLNAAHLIGNCLALLWAGWFLEGIVGRMWFAAIYTIGGVAGELLSLVLNSPNIIDVGASGAIMALFAAAYALSYHYRDKFRGRMQSRAIGVLAPALIPLGQGAAITKINVAAHLGGGAAGVVVGLLLLRGWAPGDRWPPRRRLASAITGIGCVSVLAAIWPTIANYDRVSAYAAISTALVAGSIETARRDAEAYVVRNPQDAAGWEMKGDVEFAVADPSAALSAYRTSYDLEPRRGALIGRGLSAFYAGDGAASIADLQRAEAMDTGDFYPAIWLDIVRERQGLAPSLDKTMGTPAYRWPEPVMSFLIGSISSDTLRSIAARAPKDPHTDEPCEADFYIAERDLIEGRRTSADDGFRAAVSECPPMFTETGMARSEVAHIPAGAR